ncbi:MAG: hypothetical protein E6G49_06080 [Actinobacteria bacterium]|nr:MAG: hypothetical protein E6G49_06080 [Actinomycetota bacterium]
MERGAQAASSSSILTRIGFGSLAALISVNVWTGAPLLAVWMGSKAQGNFSSLSMGAVALTVIVLAVLEFGLVLALSWVNARYDQAIGRPPLRRRYPWHSSMRGEREELIAQRQGVSGVERIAILMVVAGVLVFEFWFFFLAGSSLPNS